MLQCDHSKRSSVKQTVFLFESSAAELWVPAGGDLSSAMWAATTHSDDFLPLHVYYKHTRILKHVPSCASLDFAKKVSQNTYLHTFSQISSSLNDVVFCNYVTLFWVLNAFEWMDNHLLKETEVAVWLKLLCSVCESNKHLVTFKCFVQLEIQFTDPYWLESLYICTYHL